GQLAQTCLALRSLMSRSGCRSPSGPKKSIRSSPRHAAESCHPQLGRGSTAVCLRTWDMDQSPQQSCLDLGLVLLHGSHARESILRGNCCCKLQRSTASYCSRALEARLRALLQGCAASSPSALRVHRHCFQWSVSCDTACLQPEAGTCVTGA